MDPRSLPSRVAGRRQEALRASDCIPAATLVLLGLVMTARALVDIITGALGVA
jgi:hypothetical protein